MGFKLSFTYLTKGYLFKKGRMKVIVAKVSKEGGQLGQTPAPQPSVPSDNGNQDTFITNSYLVEVSVVAPSGQDALADEIKAFSEQLKPLVQMEKLDSRRL
jgi:mediator of RNA polymerase II transcription subunit 18